LLPFNQTTQQLQTESFASCPYWLSNYDVNPRTESLAIIRSKGSSQFQTSVDCQVIFYRSRTSRSSHNSR
jgi:hypothetical protein